ncbi:hypothetical protein B0H13DRAFT_1878137 [Mycena leptocephala]|nr:hypothetical protein B0H13DRAFT_1878137 [Mycena leptocephala]
MSLKPISLTISSTSRATLCPDGVGIVWDVTGVQLAISETTQPGHPSHPKIVEEIKFEHEDILDVAGPNGGGAESTLFIRELSQNPHRELRRRENWNDDPLTKDHTLQSYFLRLFSVQKRTQTGTTLRLPRQGVNAVIRAGTHAVILKIIGPECYASIWTPPRSANEEWHRFHEELTWDPDLIAKKLGFQNYQEEIAHVRATGDAHSPGNLGWQSGSAGSAEVHAVDGGYVYRGITGPSSVLRQPSARMIGYPLRPWTITFWAGGSSSCGDLDRNAELPLASLRFLHLGAQGTDKETVDIPFESLFALNRTDMPAAPQAEKDNSPGLPPYVVSWDGRATLFIIFRDSRNVAPEERKLSRGWFCKLSQNTLYYPSEGRLATLQLPVIGYFLILRKDLFLSLYVVVELHGVRIDDLTLAVQDTLQYGPLAWEAW